MSFEVYNRTIKKSITCSYLTPSKKFETELGKSTITILTLCSLKIHAALLVLRLDLRVFIWNKKHTGMLSLKITIFTSIKYSISCYYTKRGITNVQVNQIRHQPRGMVFSFLFGRDYESIKSILITYGCLLHVVSHVQHMFLPGDERTTEVHVYLVVK